MGPLKIHPTNPRYFSDGSGRAVYLTESHTWASLQDKGDKYPPRAFDFTAHLDFLQQHNHNFIRLWAWEHTKTNSNQYFYPSVYRRTEPGVALNGQQKFDLSRNAYRLGS
jgi:hypothetical protein